jgi:TRAP-type C4-dicarboxylate transport system permease small subunit
VLALAALVLLTLINVVVRYLTDQSFAETEEISIFLMVVLTMAGAAAAASRDRHLRIEYFWKLAAPPGDAGYRCCPLMARACSSYS